MDTFENARDPMMNELQIVKSQKALQDWLFSQISPYLHGTILELGSGLGSNSERVIAQFPKSNIYLSDLDDRYVKILSKLKKGTKSVHVLKIDAANSEDYKPLKNKIDSAFAINLLEHVENDLQSINNVYDALKPNGTFTFLVPAHMFLYNKFDARVGHYRRYSINEIKWLVNRTKFNVNKIFYFNFFAIPGWYINGILNRDTIDSSSVGLFNKLTPIFSFFEKHIIRSTMGISLIVVLKKKG